MAASSNNKPQDEIILAQEQSVTRKAGGLEKEYQGALVLTNKRLLFIAANQERQLATGKLTNQFPHPDNVL